MPNRNIKESICTSETLNELSPEAERLFYRLIVQCDDFGRLEAKPPIVRAKCFPLKLDTIKDSEVAQWLTELKDVNLIILYSNNGKPYLQMATWSKHQRKRAQYSKYPAPDDEDSSLIEAADICCQMPAIDSQPLSIDRLKRITNNEKRITNNEKRITETAAPATDKQQVTAKKRYGEFKNVLLTDDELTKLKERFPGGEAEKRIEILSEGIASKGYKYKDHYATILSWARKDEKDSGQKYLGQPPGGISGLPGQNDLEKQLKDRGIES